MHSAAIFLPLLSAIIVGFFGRWLGDRGSQIVSCGMMVTAAVLAVPIFNDVALQGHSQVIHVLSWIESGALEISWTLKFDTLTAVMVLVVTIISAIVHVYSIGYMHGDSSVPRFMAYLSLFTFFMLMLVTANDLVQLYFGWEGVGVASYLLIGFWYDRPAANAAAIKAFLVNRVGDFGFGLGIFGIFFLFDSVLFDVIFAAAPAVAGTTLHFLGLDLDALTVLCLLLFVGAMGKSAQLGLHTWLPDAMEGPTPVSALIHAATMVTAGVFMVVRLSPVFEYAPVALNVVAIVGASTAIFAATVGLVQNDIKRVIAYSTCSQLGYMFFAAGVSAYAASIFHLMTHAFFKALLFLAAGSVIHAFSGEQDMRKMGGVWKKIPLTYALMWIGSLALAGVPFFAGYYSKDMILESAYAANTPFGNYAFWMGAAAALMTAFYSWRLILMTFHGKSRADADVLAHVHESPKSMTMPLLVLALGAIFSGYVGYEYFVGHGMEAFWRGAILVLPEHSAITDAHHVPGWVKQLPIYLGMIGIALAYLFYMLVPKLPGLLAGRAQGLYRFLLNKWYFDELYDWLLVKPAKRLGRSLWKQGDGALIDGVGPDGVVAATLHLARRAGRLQTGYVYHYAFAMLIGVAGVITWLFIGKAG